jgi:hypothetical protein
VLSSGSAVHAEREEPRVVERARTVNGARVVVIAEDAAQRGRRQAAPPLGEENRGAAATLRAQVRRNTGVVRVRGREIDASALRRPPPTLDREARRVGGRALPVAPEREAVRHVPDRVDPARGPAAVGRFQYPRRGWIPDEERVVVRPVEVEVARSALPVRLEEHREDVERFARRACPLEPEPDEVHAEEARRPERLAREDGLVPDRDPVLVDALLEPPEPVRLRPDDRRRLRDLCELEILAADTRTGLVPAPWQLHDALTLARRPVAVLREERHAVARRARQRDQRVAAHRRATRAAARGCQGRVPAL